MDAEVWRSRGWRLVFNYWDDHYRNAFARVAHETASSLIEGDLPAFFNTAFRGADASQPPLRGRVRRHFDHSGAARSPQRFGAFLRARSGSGNARQRRDGGMPHFNRQRRRLDRRASGLNRRRRPLPNADAGDRRQRPRSLAWGGPLVCRPGVRSTYLNFATSKCIPSRRVKCPPQ